MTISNNQDNLLPSTQAHALPSGRSQRPLPTGLPHSRCQNQRGCGAELGVQVSQILRPGLVLWLSSDFLSNLFSRCQSSFGIRGRKSRHSFHSTTRTYLRLAAARLGFLPAGVENLYLNFTVKSDFTVNFQHLSNLNERVLSYGARRVSHSIHIKPGCTI